MLRAFVVVAAALVAALGGVGVVTDTVFQRGPSNENEPDENESDSKQGEDALGPLARVALLKAKTGDDGPPDPPVDCSIPDNADDSACDKGDVQDSQGAVGDSGDLESAGGPDATVPRGPVQAGAGGARRLSLR
jgi:hypothetical protein